MKLRKRSLKNVTGDYDPPYKTLFFVCYSTVAAIVAAEAGLLGKSDLYAENQSYDAFGDEWHLVNEAEHPWCGFGRVDDVEVGYLVPDGNSGVRFINGKKYEKLLAERPEEA